jgi:hypothetical protein
MPILVYSAQAENYWDSFSGDDFTGTNGDPLNTEVWSDPYTNHSTTNFGAEIQDNAGRLYLTGVASAGSDSCAVDSKFSISGDFDIQIDFLNLVHNNHLAAGFQFGFEMDDGDYVFIKPQYYSGGSFLVRFYDGSVDDNTYGRSNNYGQLRITRTGTTVNTYTVDGGPASWTLRKSGTLSSDDGHIVLFLYDYNAGSEIRCDFDNFLINSGTIIAP